MVATSEQVSVKGGLTVDVGDITRLAGAVLHSEAAPSNNSVMTHNDTFVSRTKIWTWPVYNIYVKRIVSAEGF